MPVYSKSPFAALPEVALPGKPAYFYGSLPSDTADTHMRVTNVALTSNVATLTVVIDRGNIPATGNLITVQGTTQAAGAFNVTAVALTGVTIDGTGSGTVTFALTHANVTSVADSGEAIVPIAETSEALANNTSVAVYVPSQEANDMGAKSITTAISFPTLPTACSVKLYSAINNIDSEYTLVGTVATVSASAQTAGPLVTFDTSGNTSAIAGRFFRLAVSGLSGTGTIIAKIVP